MENHINYIYRPHGEMSEEEAFGLAALFNSQLMDDYFRALNGNTQVNATDIRNMPLPPSSEIVNIGRLVKRAVHGNIELPVDAYFENAITSCEPPAAEPEVGAP
jgi:hypothetical protein